MKTIDPLSQVLLGGNAAQRLYPTVAMLRDLSIEATFFEPEGIIPRLPVRGIVIADAFPPGTDRRSLSEQRIRTHHSFAGVLPFLTSFVRGILIGYSQTDNDAERAEFRTGLKDLLHRFQVTAAKELKIDAAFNAIEVPETYDAPLLEHRVVDHLKYRGAPLVSGVVVRLENLKIQSISAAASTNLV